MYPNLIEHISKYTDLTEQDIQTILKYVEVSHFKDKDYLLKKGEVCKNIYFVKTGCLRMFICNNKGTEQITQFALDSWWLSDYFSFTGQSSSDYYIQAIEDSEVWSFNSKVFEMLLEELPELEHYFRIILQKAVAASQLRVKLLYELSKEELYIHFANSFPDFIQRVPQYMIASYLNLTPEYVSEIRKKSR